MISVKLKANEKLVSKNQIVEGSPIDVILNQDPLEKSEVTSQ